VVAITEYDEKIMPRRSAKDAAATRLRIMDEAQKLFAERGYGDTSIAAIVKAAGVTDGALFHHFKDKKALFTEVVEKLHKEIHQAIYEAGREAKSAREAFRIGARASMQITQMPHHARIVFIEAPAICGTENWRSLDAELGLKLIEDNLKHIAEERELPDKVLKPMAMMALGTINELTYAAIRDEPGVDYEDCLQLLEDALDHWIEHQVKPWKAANS
jgi:AcrR family transcriptional regulator